MDLMTERLQSLKAGVLGGFCLFLAYLITSLLNSLVLTEHFSALSSLNIQSLDWHFLLSGSFVTFSGFLFGVTYRYIIRQDQNPHLKSGGVLAFGLVRGLTQIDVGVTFASTIVPLIVMATESVFWFAIAAIALDAALQQGWIKAFRG
ncbi:MAG: hypothetical protein IGS49_17075 [Chlorogloeopsis fritschii C42_A2020_084]|jgi:hypothetical protein|uniref:hypothetical protein n=1 Tax=Chlorogloeopsis fritschii TaxID=1124 RepID=UPI001A0ED409|nr:hypothetical protein [Chlorogloeopsis fritschii]MBF2007126.1 hypothetical protein [Chlorogloeopsis fritschii C42_A2020_084]